MFLPIFLATLLALCSLCAFLFDNDHVYNGSCSKTSSIVTIVDLFSRRTSIVFSHDLRNTPSTPVQPSAETRSRVKRNGIVSGVGKHLPCSKAMPI